MLKVIAVLHRKDGISREQFVRHWRDEHAALVEQLPGLQGYRQNVPIAHRSDWFADGVAELWFESLKSVAMAFDSLQAEAMRADESAFIGATEWLIAEEFDVVKVPPVNEFRA